jgi:hypothetical protein
VDLQDLICYEEGFLLSSRILTTGYKGFPLSGSFSFSGLAAGAPAPANKKAAIVCGMGNMFKLKSVADLLAGFGQWGWPGYY